MQQPPLPEQTKDKIVIEQPANMGIALEERGRVIALQQENDVITLFKSNATPLICALDGFREKEEDDADVLLNKIIDWDVDLHFGNGGNEKDSTESLKDILKDFVVVRKQK